MLRTITIMVLLASTGALAQTTLPSFDVASIRPNISGGSSSHVSRHSGEILLQNVSLREVIEMAYEIQDFGVSGPPWMASEKFDIMAKPPADAPKDQLGPMLQSLLAERFKLTIHRESKTMAAYALVVDKTETTGSFDFALHFTPDANAAEGDSGPSLFTALQEQMGLKLVAQKLPVEIVVVDHVEKVPTEN